MSTTTAVTAGQRGPWAARPGPLWFATLGGGIAWAVHEVATWSTVELTCRSGRADVAGIPLRGFAVTTTVLPALVAVAAVVVSLVAVRALRGAEGRTADRARLMATVGCWLNLLSLLVILFGGAAVLVLEPCVT